MVFSSMLLLKRLPASPARVPDLDAHRRDVFESLDKGSGSFFKSFFTAVLSQALENPPSLL